MKRSGEEPLKASREMFDCVSGQPGATLGQMRLGGGVTLKRVEAYGQCHSIGSHSFVE